MWVIIDDYKSFTEKTGILYFKVDLAKVLSEMCVEAESLNGITMEKFHNGCVDLCKMLDSSCPKDMEFREYLLANFPKISLDSLNILLALHKEIRNS